MNIDVLMTGPLGVNCSLISHNGELVIIDPGGNQKEIDEYISDKKLKPLAVVNTHGHFDHIGAVDGLVKKYNIPFMMHKDDEFLLSQGSKVMELYGLGGMMNPSVDAYIEHGQKIKLGSIEFDVIHTPGHTPGGCCFYIKDAEMLITGDTLFLESVGRSDFPYSDGNTLIKHIKERLFVLPDDTEVCPGHGEFSSVGHEKKHNPYV